MADYLKKIREQTAIANGATPAKKEDKRGQGYEYNYKPNKNDRATRAHIWDRYQRMKDDPMRREAERDWEQADKLSRLWRPERDPDDWRADIRLPDAFSAIQTHLQETVGVKIRPSLKPQEGSDTPLAFWGNGILTYNMDRTGFDFETIKAFNCAASRGTAFTVEEYFYETRMVQDPDSVQNGILQYKSREIIDKDDTFTKQWPNERIFIDEAATCIEEAEDCILEERMRLDTFHMKYSDREDCYNVDQVIPCGSISPKSNFFQRSDDDPMDGDYVQVLRYYNKMTDSYQILANTVVICDQPIPFKHKELPVAIWNYYPVEGRIYGMGIPKIIAPTQEEREAIRNLSLDRQKMHLNKMFLVSDLFDIDEDEATTRPHGFIHVNSGGLNLDQVIKPLEYGDVPGSSVRMDDMLRDDEQRVTGIDDRSQSVNVGGTATEASIITEQSQKRINLINTLTGMSTTERVGKLKWSNIQFFYPAPRVIDITQDDDTKAKTQKVYRNISIDGHEFNIVEDDDGTKALQMNDVNGTASFKLDSTHARFFDNLGDVDIRIQWDIKAVLPQAIRQSKVMELFNGLMGNPMTMQQINVRRVMKDIIQEYDFDPQTWLTDQGKTIEEQQSQAYWENLVMMKGIALDPTEGADEQHTLVHLQFTESDFYKKFVANNPGIAAIFQRHIMGENENGPGGAAAGQTSGAPAAGMSGEPGMGATGPGGPAPIPGGPPAPGSGTPTPPPNVMAAAAKIKQAQAAAQSAAPAQPPATPGNVNGGQVSNQQAPNR